jgi:hypothetical protein
MDGNDDEPGLSRAEKVVMAAAHVDELEPGAPERPYHGSAADARK